MNGADRLCDTLLINGVDTCFANPGTSEMHFVAALDRKPEMPILTLVCAWAPPAARSAARPKPTVAPMRLKTAMIETLPRFFGRCTTLMPGASFAAQCNLRSKTA